MAQLDPLPALDVGSVRQKDQSDPAALPSRLVCVRVGKGVLGGAGHITGTCAVGNSGGLRLDITERTAPCHKMHTTKMVRQRAGTTHGADSPNVAVANVVVNVRGQLPNGAAWPRARSSKVRQPGFEIVTSAICHVAERLVRSPGLGLLLLLRLRHRRCWERVRGGAVLGTVAMQLVVGGTVIGILAILSDILSQAVFRVLRILIVNKIRVWCIAVVVQLAFKSVGERVQILQ